jgi:hypothetical protein
MNTALRSLVEAIPMHQGLLDRMATIASLVPRHGWHVAMIVSGFIGAIGQWQWCSNGQCSPTPDGTILCTGIAMLAVGMAMFHRILIMQDAGGRAPRAFVEGAYWVTLFGATLATCAVAALLGQAYWIVNGGSVADLHMQLVIWSN